MKVQDLYEEIVMHHDMNKIPVGYKSYCLHAIKETLSKNNISMEREVTYELSESILSKSNNESISELYEYEPKYSSEY